MWTTYFNNQIKDVADTPHAGVDAAYGLRIKRFKSREHGVVVWCVVAYLAKDLERWVRVNDNNIEVLDIIYLLTDTKFFEAFIEFFCEIITRVTSFEAEKSSVRKIGKHSR